MNSRRGFFKALGLGLMSAPALVAKAASEPVQKAPRSVYINGILLREPSDFEYDGNGIFRFTFKLLSGAKADLITIPYAVDGHIRALTHFVKRVTLAQTPIKVFDPHAPNTLPYGFKAEDF